MSPGGRKPRGIVEELRCALEQGRLEASAYRQDPKDRLEEIPAAESTNLELRPPKVSFAEQSKFFFRWTNRNS